MEQYANIGGALAKQCGAPQEPPRTFNSLENVVGRLKATRRQLDAMLERISPQPCEETTSGLAIGLTPRALAYAVAVEDIHRELDRIGDTLGALEKHI